MRDEHRPEAEACRRAEQPPHEYEHQHQRDTGDDVGVYHGDIRHGVHRCAQVLIAHTVDADSGGGAHDGGDYGCAEREDKRIPDCTERLRVLHKLAVPVEGEAGENGKAFGLVEREEQQYRYRREQENHNEGGVHLGHFFHASHLLSQCASACRQSAASAPCPQAGLS